MTSVKKGGLRESCPECSMMESSKQSLSEVICIKILPSSFVHEEVEDITLALGK